MKINQLETPCLLLDLGRLLRNIERMAKHISDLGGTLRPHVKTAKSLDVLRLAMERDARGITVSTLKEAEYFLDHGVRDILYAVGIAPNKLEHVAALRCRGADVAIVLDSVQQAQMVASNARSLGRSYAVLIEIDCDGHRSGVQPHDPVLFEIARVLRDAPGCELRGVMAHGGESYACKGPADILKLARRERDLTVGCASALRAAGFACPVVSIGSTPTATLIDDLSGVTEVRAGVYVFQDLTIAQLGLCSFDDIAICVLGAVIGHQKDKRWVITDTGWMSLSSDRSTAALSIDQGYGLVCDAAGNPYGDLIVKGTNQEHGIIADRHGRPIDLERFPIGSLVRILPNHACATAAAHDGYPVVEGDDVVLKWPRVSHW